MLKRDIVKVEQGAKMHKGKRQLAIHSRPAPGISKPKQVKGVANNYVTQCPCCGQSIEPRVMAYLPRPGTFKQYRCEHCAAWLTIDLRSRIKLIVVATIGLLLIATGSAELLVATGVPIHGHETLALLPFAIVFGVGGQYALARYMRKIAKWVAVTY